MKLIVLVMRDIKANLHMAPMFVPNIFAAQRDLADMINEKKQPEAWIRHPEDFELKKIGEWDSETAEYTACKPEQICVLDSLKSNHSA